MHVPWGLKMKNNQSRVVRCRFESLESRRLLAGDGLASTLAMDVNVDGRVTAADALRVINGLSVVRSTAETVIADSATAVDRALLDVNADGMISASDALRVINSLEPKGVSAIADRVLLQVRQGLTESRLEVLDGIFGQIDGAEGPIDRLIDSMNRLRSGSGLSTLQVGQLLDDMADLLQSESLPSSDSLDALADVWTEVWSDRELSSAERIELRSAIGDVLGSTGIEAERVDSILDRIDSIYDRFADQSADQTVASGIESAIEELRQFFAALPDDIGIDLPWIRRVAERIDHLIDRDGGIATVLDLVETFSDLDQPVNLPSVGSTLSLLNDLRAARADGVVDTSERDQLRGSFDQFFTSIGLVEGTRITLLDQLGRLWSSRSAS